MKYFLIAGEASGDLHASNLMQEIKNVDQNAQFCFLGGDLMIQQGGKMVRHYRQMAFMGISRVILNLRTILKNLSDCKQSIVEFQPDTIILVDYPSFNLRVAKWAKRQFPQIKIIYYISPKIWAWKEWRIHTIRKVIDKMFTIFPFEKEFYARHHYSVEYVGNPTVDSIYNRPNQDITLEGFCNDNDLPSKPIIAILGGSRVQEIESCLQRMVQAGLSFNDFQVIVSGAPGVKPEVYNKILNHTKVEIIFNKTYELLQVASAAIVNSGTATLETALIGTPEVVVYHIPLGKFGYFVKEKLIRVRYVSLVNILAKKMIVRELLAHQFTTDNLKKELRKILFEDNYRKELLNNYNAIKTELGKPGAAKRTAGIIVNYTSQHKKD